MAMLQRLTALTRKPYTDPSGWYDLTYVTPQLIVTSMPTTSFWRSFYRTPAADLLAYLDRVHESNWHLWNLQESSESSYEDETFHDRVTRRPIPDHAPPPFADLISIAGEITAHVGSGGKHVAVVHCKAGKGRSGTIACAFLQLHHGMSYEQATARFTESRMRPLFGQGVSILSQQRYLHYIAHWIGLFRPPLDDLASAVVEVRSIVVRGAKFEDIGIAISGRRAIVGDEDGDRDAQLIASSPPGLSASRWPLAGYFGSSTSGTAHVRWDVVTKPSASGDSKVLIYYPANNGPVVLPPDISVTINRAASVKGLAVPHGSATFWFNAAIEHLSSEITNAVDGTPFGPWHPAPGGPGGDGANAGFFSLTWHGTDGIAGTPFKGTPLFDTVEVYWTLVGPGVGTGALSGRPVSGVGDASAGASLYTPDLASPYQI